MQRRSAEGRQAFLSPPLPRPAPRSGGFTSPMAARVELENHAGNTSSPTVRFEPILEEETLYQVWEHDCWGLLGHKQTVTHHDFPLANQWQVVESRLQGSALGWFGSTSGIGGGCIEKREPTPGSADPGYRFEGWCNALNIVWCDTWVDVRGPRGTGHR